jgi:hypothetical protein
LIKSTKPHKSTGSDRSRPSAQHTGVSEVGMPAGLKRAKYYKISKVNKSRQDKPQRDSSKGQSPVSGVP